MKRLLLIGCAALVCCSCAFTNPRNRPLMNWCERHLVPESTAGMRSQRLSSCPCAWPRGCWTRWWCIR